MSMCISSFSATCVSICQSLLTHLYVHLVLPHQCPASLLDLPRPCDWPPHCRTCLSFHFIRAVKVFLQLTTPSFLPWNTLSSCLLQVFLPASPACLPYWFLFHTASECWCSSGFSPSLYTCTACLGDFIPIHSQLSAVDNYRCIFSWAAEFPVSCLLDIVLGYFTSNSDWRSSMHCCFLFLSNGPLVFFISKKGPPFI